MGSVGQDLNPCAPEGPVRGFRPPPPETATEGVPHSNPDPIRRSDKERSGKCSRPPLHGSERQKRRRPQRGATHSEAGGHAVPIARPGSGLAHSWIDDACESREPRVLWRLDLHSDRRENPRNPPKVPGNWYFPPQRETSCERRETFHRRFSEAVGLVLGTDQRRSVL